jgi:hypothetical protein
MFRLAPPARFLQGIGSTADDPRMFLIGAHAQETVFLEVNKPKPLVLFVLARGIVTASPPIWAAPST